MLNICYGLVYKKHIFIVIRVACYCFIFNTLFDYFLMNLLSRG
jgi:hypothetical protein